MGNIESRGIVGMAGIPGDGQTPVTAEAPARWIRRRREAEERARREAVAFNVMRSNHQDARDHLHRINIGIQATIDTLNSVRLSRVIAQRMVGVLQRIMLEIEKVIEEDLS